MKIAIIGDGGWGTANALLLAGYGHEVTVWGHDAAYIAEIAASRANPPASNFLCRILRDGVRDWCRRRDSNPHAKDLARDFKSLVSAIPPLRRRAYSLPQIQP